MHGIAGILLIIWSILLSCPSNLSDITPYVNVPAKQQHATVRFFPPRECQSQAKSGDAAAISAQPVYSVHVMRQAEMPVVSFVSLWEPYRRRREETFDRIYKINRIILDILLSCQRFFPLRSLRLCERSSCLFVSRQDAKDAKIARRD